MHASCVEPSKVIPLLILGLLILTLTLTLTLTFTIEPQPVSQDKPQSEEARAEQEKVAARQAASLAALAALAPSAAKPKTASKKTRKKRITTEIEVDAKAIAKQGSKGKGGADKPAAAAAGEGGGGSSSSSSLAAAAPAAAAALGTPSRTDRASSESMDILMSLPEGLHAASPRDTLSSPPPTLAVPDDYDEGGALEGRGLPSIATPQKSSFSLKRRTEAGWVRPSLPTTRVPTAPTLSACHAPL